jgi:hypothetical protein
MMSNLRSSESPARIERAVFAGRGKDGRRGKRSFGAAVGLRSGWRRAGLFVAVTPPLEARERAASAREEGAAGGFDLAAGRALDREVRELLELLEVLCAITVGL